ncbi:MAG: hemin uptake protein HemP [Rhodoblastus sp.]
MADPPPRKGAQRDLPPSSERKPREIDLRDLVGDEREVSIVHDGERYRLRVTANNKLILTK